VTRAAGASSVKVQVSGGMPGCHSVGASVCLPETLSGSGAVAGGVRAPGRAAAGARRTRRASPHPLGYRSAAAIRHQALRRLLSAMAPKRGGHVTISVTSKAGERVAATFSHPSVMRMLRGAVAELADAHGAYARPAGSPWTFSKSAPWEVRKANQTALALVVERRAAQEFLQTAGAAVTVLPSHDLAALLAALPTALAA